MYFFIILQLRNNKPHHCFTAPSVTPSSNSATLIYWCRIKVYVSRMPDSTQLLFIQPRGSQSFCFEIATQTLNTLGSQNATRREVRFEEIQFPFAMARCSSGRCFFQ